LPQLGQAGAGVVCSPSIWHRVTVRQRPSCDEDHISSTVISIGAPPVLAASATPTGRCSPTFYLDEGN
jgi:hypothetical protein